MTTQPWTPKPRKDEKAETRTIPTMYFSATRDEARGEMFLKVVNTIASAQPVRFELDNIRQVQPGGQQVVLSAAGRDETNSITDPARIVPVASAASGFAPRFSYTFAPYSVTVLTIPVR